MITLSPTHGLGTVTGTGVDEPAGAAGGQSLGDESEASKGRFFGLAGPEEGDNDRRAAAYDATTDFGAAARL
jgi:hypothetical protein